MAAADRTSVAKRGVVTPFVRRASKDDDRPDLVDELERLRRENVDLRAQLAAERAQIVMDAALSAAARVLAVVRGEAELRVAEARWALTKMRDESDAAIAQAHDELARLASLKRQVSDQTNAFAEFDDREACGFRMLAVDPLCQGGGAGGALVRWCIERARGEGRARVTIHSTPWMTRAHELYGRLGFVRRPDLDWQPVPNIRLLGFVLELSPRT